MTADVAREGPSTGWRLIRAATVIAIFALMAVLALGFRRDPRDIRSAVVGQPAPAFDLERIDEPGRVRLADMGGKVVIVNFYASWCVPCKEEAPALVRVWERYRRSDVVFVGIVYQDSPQAAKDFHGRLGQTWPAALDDNGRTALAFGVFGVPETYFIGKDGKVEGRHIGPIDEITLTRAIETLRSR